MRYVSTTHILPQSPTSTRCRAHPRRHNILVVVVGVAPVGTASGTASGAASGAAGYLSMGENHSHNTSRKLLFLL